MSRPPFTTVFAIYPNLTHLDFTGPHQVLCRIPGATTVIASRDGGEIEAEGGLVIGRTQKLADIAHCDLICVPGGMAATETALDAAFVSEVRRLALGAKYVTSVCTLKIFSANGSKLNMSAPANKVYPPSRKASPASTGISDSQSKLGGTLFAVVAGTVTSSLPSTTSTPM